MYVIETDRATYYTDHNGAVVARTNGPRGWNYSDKWIILGVKKRYHSRNVIPLFAAANGEDFGHGIIRDNDNGTLREWHGERARHIRMASSLDIKTAERLQRKDA